MKKEVKFKKTGDRLRKCRNEFKFTQEQLAERVNMPLRQYSDMERGVTNPKHHAIDFARIFGTQPEYFTGESDYALPFGEAIGKYIPQTSDQYEDKKMTLLLRAMSLLGYEFKGQIVSTQSGYRVSDKPFIADPSKPTEPGRPSPYREACYIFEKSGQLIAFDMGELFRFASMLQNYLEMSLQDIAAHTYLMPDTAAYYEKDKGVLYNATPETRYITHLPIVSIFLNELQNQDNQQ